MKDVQLLTEMFIPGTLIGPFTNAHPGLGGVCTFVGEVRRGDDSEVEALELSYYEPLTHPGMEALADTALCHRGGRFLYGPSEKRRVVLEAREGRRRMDVDRTAR